MFSGSIPALVTPFDADGGLDEGAYRAFVDWQVAEGSSALVPCGTTGESATLSFDEHYRVIDLTLEAAAGRVPVIAGCGSNDTATAVRHMAFAQQAGAAAALVVAPYYNRPSQDGIYAHYAHLADKSDLPIVLYNVPGRTVTDILPETVARLAQIPSIIGIKDASGIVSRATAHRVGAGADFLQLCGNDEMALAFNASGGRGCISVTANAAPRLCAEFQAASVAGDMNSAHALNDKLFALHLAMFADTSPGPVKYAVGKTWGRSGGRMGGTVRLPIVEPGAAARAKVDEALAIAGLA